MDSGARQIVNGFRLRDLLGALIVGLIAGYGLAVGAVASMSCRTWCGW